MKKEWVILSLFILLLGIGVANADMTPYPSENHNSNLQTGFYEGGNLILNSDGYNYNLRVYMQKGWNLVLFSDFEEINEDSPIKKIDIFAAYVYASDKKRYLQVYPDTTEFNSYLNELSSSSESSRRIKISPMWLYSNKEGYLEYSRSGVPKIDEITLVQGWNFITITPEIIGKDLNDIKGNCNLEKAYFWTDKERPEGSWVNHLNTNQKYDKSIGGLGIVVKVTSDCKLKTSNLEIPSLPALP